LQKDGVVTLERLPEKEKYGRILCYPKCDLAESEKRINELKRLGVKALEFKGEKTVNNVAVLGKGCVGIVVLAHTNEGKAALKIRRTDANRNEMHHEAEMLKKANTVGVGPKLLNSSENFLLMEVIKGSLLFQWLSTLRGRRKKARIMNVLKNILEQCWQLDTIGLDHGELSKAPKHIIINAEDLPHIVDFETASDKRRVTNVTSICQYLFIGSEVAKTLNKKLGHISKDELIENLRSYKKMRSRRNFDNILETCLLA